MSEQIENPKRRNDVLKFSDSRVERPFEIIVNHDISMNYACNEDAANQKTWSVVIHLHRFIEATTASFDISES